MSDGLSRREFLQQTAVSLGLAGILTTQWAQEVLAEDIDKTDKLPKRTLGRTKEKVSIIALGFGPLGIARYEPKHFEAVCNEAIDLGVTYFDTAPGYGDAEEKLGPVMKKRRDEVFLVTKCPWKSYAEAWRGLRESLSKMQTDRIDLVHLHNLGDFDLDQTWGRDGALRALKEAKKAGLIRFIGASGHMRPWKFVHAITSGEIDVIMPAVNFVDRFTYNFEEKVLPVAVRHNVGVVAMKVLGGAKDMKYDPPQDALLSGEHYQDAIRYAIFLPGVASINLGLKNSEQLQKAVAAVKSATPLTSAQQESLFSKGRELAKKWGAHFGPVV